MFRGQFLHTVDSKGRVSLPARFRDSLLADGEARLVLTPAPFDPCLHLYPLRAWEAFEQKIAELPSLDPNVVRFRRMYVSAAIECELDKTGRVLVPQELRERLHVEKDVLWAGMGRILELWSKTEWERALAMTPEQEADFKRAVMEQIRI
jgi:MraZ protein